MSRKAALALSPVTKEHREVMAKRKFQIDQLIINSPYEELIEAYRGTTSLPFEPGDHKRVAVKIIDDRGIESLKIVEVG